MKSWLSSKLKPALNKVVITAGTVSLLPLLPVEKAHAVCPVCTVAVFGGLGLAEYLHIDDTISGLWIGALTVSMIMWTINWLNGRKIKFIGRKPLVFFGYLALIELPLYLDFKKKGIYGNVYHQLWGVDKLFLGIGIGAVLFFISAKAYIYMKARNNNRAHFPFEKIVLAIAPLAIMSIVFYFITKK